MQYVGSILFLLLLWGTSSEAKFFKFVECTGEFRIANVSKVDVSPDPVSLKKNMTINGIVDLFSDIPETAVLKTRFYKLKNVFGINIDIPIPCLLGKFGSCTLPLCKYLKLYREQIEPVYPPGLPYGCPVKVGTYGGENMEIQIPDMGAIARIIVSGKYRTELTLTDKGKVLACYKAHAEIK